MNRILLSLALLTLLLAACTDPDPIEPQLEVPTTYSFMRDGVSTVSYEGQTQRLDMMDELAAYLATGDQLNATVDADKILAMFANTEGADFTGSYTKDIQSKTYADDVNFFTQWIEAMAAASELQQEASEGIAGFLSETYGTATPPTVDNAGYLVDANGIEFKQVILKGLMGACFYYQAMEVYLSADRMGELGNDVNAEGEPFTDMEHYFDEAFGYFGVPVDYPLNTEGIRHWGKYTQARNDGSGSGRFTYPGINQTIMDAFLRGRAAVAAKAYPARDSAIEIIAHTWEKIAASTAADYLERAKSSNNPETYQRHHYLSEAIGFTLALKYHFEGGNSKVARQSNTDNIDTVLALIGPETNLWTLTDADIDSAIKEIITAFPAGVIE